MSFLIPAFLLLAIGFVPVTQIVLKSLVMDGHFSLEKYRLVFQSPRSWMLLLNTLVLAASVTAVSLFIGVPLGILFGKTDLYFRKVLAVLFLIPLAVPSYIFGLSWLFFLGSASKFIFGFTGTFFVMVSTLSPIIMIFTMVYLHLVNPRLEEAARLVSGWPRTLYNVTLPLILKGIGLAALVVFVLALGEYGTPSLLRYPVFSAESFTQFVAFYDFDAAIAAAVPFGIVAVLILCAERLFLGRAAYESPQLSGFQEPLRISLGRWNTRIALIVSCVAVVFVVWPLSWLFFKSLKAGAYFQAFQSGGAALLRSLLISASAAICLTVLGLFLGYGIQRKSCSGSQFVDAASIFLFALPGTVTGIALISLWNTSATSYVYASPLILILGYVSQYSALSTRMTAAIFSRVPVSFEEAGEISGASWRLRLKRILIPLAGKGLLAVAVAAFIFCLKDVSIAMMVYPPGNDTFPVRIFTLMANSPEELIAALCVILASVCILPFALLLRLVKQRGVL